MTVGMITAASLAFAGAGWWSVIAMPVCIALYMASVFLRDGLGWRALDYRSARVLHVVRRTVMASTKSEKGEVTSAKAASAASKVLKDTKSSATSKTAAGSALTQRQGGKK